MAERFAARRGARQLSIDLETQLRRHATPRLWPSGISLLVQINHLPDGATMAQLELEVAAMLRSELPAVMKPKANTAADARVSLTDHTWLMPILEQRRAEQDEHSDASMEISSLDNNAAIALRTGKVVVQ